MDWRITWKFVDWKYQARVFSGIKNDAIPMKTAVQIEKDLKKKKKVTESKNPTWVIRRRWRNDILAYAVISRYI